MNQALHIFLKDARRFWVEIAVQLAITFGFASIGASLWTQAADSHAQLLAALAPPLAFLVLVGWWLLITRVIQAERLVGDTQFWITRPYVWSSLMSAKGLFLLAFICLPFFIAQAILLAVAGFAPQHYIPGLLFNLLLYTAVLILPLTALATVTSSFARMTLTLLGILLVFIAFLIAITTMIVANGDFSSIAGGTAGPICFAIAVADCLTAIVLQYALRRVWLARGVLALLPVLLAAVTYGAGKYDQAQVDKLYPAAQDDAPIQFTYAPWTKGSETLRFSASSHARIPIEFQLAETGVAEGYAILPDVVRAEVTAADGSRWDSGWQGEFEGLKLLPGENHLNTRVNMPIADYWKFQSRPLTVHLTLGISQAQAGRTTAVPLPNGKFAVAEFGACSPTTAWTPQPGQISALHCIAPLRQPQLTYVTTRWADGPCSTGPVGPDAGVGGHAWVGSLDRAPSELNIAPVTELHLDISNAIAYEEKGKQRSRSLCPGTPIVFTQFNRVGRMQTSLDIQGFYLPKVIEANGRISVTE